MAGDRGDEGRFQAYYFRARALVQFRALGRRRDSLRALIAVGDRTPVEDNRAGDARVGCGTLSIAVPGLARRMALLE